MTRCRRIHGYPVCITFTAGAMNASYKVSVRGYNSHIGTVEKSAPVAGRNRYLGRRPNGTVCISDERKLQKATDCLFREWDENRAYAERDRQHRDLAEGRA